MINNKSIHLIFFILLKISESLDTPIPAGDTTITWPDGDVTSYDTQDGTSTTINPLRGSGTKIPLVPVAGAKKKKKKKNRNKDTTTEENEELNVFTLGEPTMFGSGCPEGSVDIISSSDGQTVTVLFSEYIAITSNDDLNNRVSCNLAIPVGVIQGFAVGVFSVDYRGYTVVPSDPNSYSEFTAEYFFAGNPGPVTRKQYVDYTGEVSLSDQVKNMAVVYSECGSDTIFRINTSIKAMKGGVGDEDVFIEVDSTDTTVTQSFTYYVDSQPCA